MDVDFKWIGFYTTFADKLLDFKDNRMTLIEKIKNAYKSVGIDLPKLEKDGVPKDIDPFTIYGLFNKGITNENHQAIIGALNSEFEVNAEVPEDFSGIPVLMNMSATFYAFEDTRKEHDIDNLWNVFVAAINFVKSKSSDDREDFCRFYNQALTQAHVKWNLTMGLYWICPYDYLNLDARNRWFMEDPRNMPDDLVAEIKALKGKVPAGEKYLDIRDKTLNALSTGSYEYNSFPALSHKAWIVSEEENQKLKEKEKSNDKPNASIDTDVVTQRIWLYAPGENAYKWEEFYNKGIMAMGWPEAGNLALHKSKDEIKKPCKVTEIPMLLSRTPSVCFGNSFMI